MTLSRRIAWSLAWPAALFAAGAMAGIFDNPKNLRVLPEDISPQELGKTMRGFAQDLGLRCEGCHVGEANQPLETFDFAKDQKDRKATARLMLRMVAEINDRQLAELDRAPEERVKVGCVTCHRGQPKPLQLTDALDLAYREGGVTAAVARYRALKSEFFGSGSYDFTERPRLEFATRLGGRADAPGGIAFLRELHDEYRASFMTDMTLGDLYLAAGDRASAIESLRAAETSAPPPAKPVLRKRLETLEKEDAT